MRGTLRRIRGWKALLAAIGWLWVMGTLASQGGWVGWLAGLVVTTIILVWAW